MFNVLQPEGWAPAKGYANGIEARGRMVFVAGMIGWNGQAQFETDDFVAQCRQALQNIVDTLACAGAGPQHMARMTWYVKDKKEYLARGRELGKVYQEVIGKNYPAIVKELQRHPVRRTVSHIDFQQISMTEEIIVNVPIRLEGTAKAVLAEGALVDAAVDSIEVRTTPQAMPNEIVIDITNMTIHDVIRLDQVALPKGVTAVGDPETAVVTVLTYRVEAARANAPAESTDEAAPSA
jgi:ribosomal protein bL25 (Ctc-form)